MNDTSVMKLSRAEIVADQYEGSDEKVGEASSCYANLDNEWHQYVIDLSSVEDGVTIIFNGGYTDNTGADSSEYVFSGITLY